MFFSFFWSYGVNVNFLGVGSNRLKRPSQADTGLPQLPSSTWYLIRFEILVKIVQLWILLFSDNLSLDKYVLFILRQYKKYCLTLDRREQ